MKQIINVLTVIAIVVVMFSHATAQTRVVKDGQGNYTVATQSKSGNDKVVGSFVNPKGEKFPVYESAKGKLYYLRVSKNGNTYRCYLVSEAAKPNKVGDN